MHYFSYTKTSQIKGLEQIDNMVLWFCNSFLKIPTKKQDKKRTSKTFLNNDKQWMFWNIMPLFMYLLPTCICRQTFPASCYKEKIELCEDQLRVMELAEPGLTKSRGRLLYELSDSLLMYHNAHYQRGKLSSQNMIAIIDSCLGNGRLHNLKLTLKKRFSTTSSQTSKVGK